MRTTNTFSILFWVDQKKAILNYVLIYARVTVNGKRVNISTKRKVPLGIWDAKKKKAIGKTSEARQIPATAKLRLVANRVRKKQRKRKAFIEIYELFV